MSNKREWNNSFIKTNQEILLYLADFAFQEEPEDNVMVAISRALYNGSYTMTAKLIKSLERPSQILEYKTEKRVGSEPDELHVHGASSITSTELAYCSSCKFKLDSFST